MPLQQTLYREAFRMLGERFEAEDAVQNLYMRLWQQKDILQSLNSPEAYCMKILRNICIDRWRTIRAEEEKNIVSEEIVTENSPPDIERTEAAEFLQHFLAGLPGQQRRVMQMQMRGNSLDEIAKMTGLSAVNVRVIISRIRKRFKEIYFNQ